MKMPKQIDKQLLAPCGVLCLACSAYLDEKKPCPGCRAPKEAHKRKSCQNCVKKRCAFEKGHAFCFSCKAFPCQRIKSLNARYVQHYGVDLVQNGHDARRDMDAFLQVQKKCFTCPHCGGVVDQHHRRCSECKAQAD